MDKHERAFCEWWIEHGIEVRAVVRKAFYAGAEHGIDLAAAIFKEAHKEETDETE